MWEEAVVRIPRKRWERRDCPESGWLTRLKQSKYSSGPFCIPMSCSGITCIPESVSNFFSESVVSSYSHILRKGTQVAYFRRDTHCCGLHVTCPLKGACVECVVFSGESKAGLWGSDWPQ